MWNYKETYRGARGYRNFQEYDRQATSSTDGGNRNRKGEIGASAPILNGKEIKACPNEANGINDVRMPGGWRGTAMQIVKFRGGAK